MNVYWKDVKDNKNQWCGMAVRVSESAKPVWHLQAGADRRIKLVAGNKTLFWATLLKDYGGVWLIKTLVDLDITDMPVSPIRSADIESRANLQGDEWLKSWSRFFVEQLEKNQCSILYDGLWLLGPCFAVSDKKDWQFMSSVHSRYMGTNVVYQVKDALKTDEVELLSWWLNGNGELINLKKPQADSGRVKWWRKKVREGRLPPILVLYLSCLDAYIIIDGHDRLMASIIENQPPELIAISSAQEIHCSPDLVKQEQVLASLSHPKSDRKKSISVEHMNQVLLQAFDDSPFVNSRSSSWASITSDQMWVDEVAEFLRKINQQDKLDNIVNHED
jgi:hypothetical protein